MDNIWHFRIVQPAACNSTHTTCHSTVQRSSTEYGSLRNTILIDRIRSLAIISSSKCTIQDPLNGDQFQFQDRVLSVWWSFIFEHDRWMDCVRWSRLDRRWSGGGPRAGAIMVIFGDDAKMWVVLLVSWLCNQLLAICG